MSIERILDNPDWNWDYDGLYRRPGIPNKKLAGAIGAYAPGVNPDDVLVLVDDTVFGSAKEGLLITRDAMYAKNSFQAPRMIRFRDVRKIAPGKSARIHVNGEEFFKADIVEHFAILAVAARLASLHESSQAGSGGSDALATRYAMLSKRAMDHVHRELGDDVMLVDEMLQRQSSLLVPHLSSIEQAVRKRARGAASEPRIEADTLEMAHLLLQVLHFYAMSQLPEAFKAHMGEDLEALYAVSECYKDGYRDAFAAAFSKGFEVDGDKLRAITAAFFHRDGTGELDMNVPRHDAIVQMLEQFGGLTETIAVALRTNIERVVVWWLSAIEASGGAEHTEEEDGEDDEPHANDAHLDEETHQDHYAVLGIRPRASSTEIDLAFKGRRSQYHPDRYANEDADTIAWATREMQRVNEAYAVLSDEAKRSRFDAQRSASTTRPAPRGPADGAARPAAPDKPLRNPPADAPDLRDYFTRLALSPEDRARVHVAPNIPREKLHNAMDARNWGTQHYVGTPLVLIDDTMRGGAKEGVLISDKCISFKSLFLDPEEYVTSHGFNEGFDARGSAISRMGDECKDFVHISKRGVVMICEALNAFFRDLRTWHRERAEAGDASSANYMSMSCTGDRAQELHWLRRAAEGGLRVAQHNLGMKLQHEDPAEAFRWFSVAAAQGCTSSRERLEHERFDSLRRRQHA